MTNRLSRLAAPAAAALAVGAIALVVLRSDAPAPDPGVEQRLADLERGLAAVTEENQRLRARQAAEAAGPTSAPDPEPKREPTPDPDPDLEPPPSQEEQDAAWEENVAVARTRRGELLDGLAESAQLAPEVRATVSTLLLEEHDHSVSLFRAARAGEISFYEASKASATRRRANDSEVRALLADDQYAQFEALRRAENQRPPSPR